MGQCPIPTPENGKNSLRMTRFLRFVQCFVNGHNHDALDDCPAQERIARPGIRAVLAVGSADYIFSGAEKPRRSMLVSRMSLARPSRLM